MNVSGTITLDYALFSSILLFQEAAKPYPYSQAFGCYRTVFGWKEEQCYTRKEVLLLWLAMLQHYHLDMLDDECLNPEAFFFFCVVTKFKIIQRFS